MYGHHPVAEYLRRQPAEITALWLLQRREDRHPELESLAARGGIPVSYASGRELERLCGAAQHQGVVAVLRDFPYVELGELAGRGAELLFAADGIEDPRNLGALIRAVAAAAAGGLVIPRDRASAVTSTVEKASAGVTSILPICRVVNMTRSLEELKSRYGYWVVGLSQRAEQDLFDVQPPLPAVVVIGGEEGLRPLVSRTCDLLLRIPMAAGVESLNVAVAAAVAAFELRRKARTRRP